MKTWHPRLHVYLAWHPDTEPALGKELAAAIAQRISRDTTRPFDRDIGIPVFFHSAAPEGEPTPPSIHWDQALQTVVVVLIEVQLTPDEDEDDIRRRMQAALDEVIEEVLAYTYALELLRYWQRQGWRISNA